LAFGVANGAAGSGVLAGAGASVRVVAGGGAWAGAPQAADRHRSSKGGRVTRAILTEPERGSLPGVLRGLIFLWLASGTPTPVYSQLGGVEIPAAVEPRLRALATAYHRVTGKSLVITDGTRRPATQAALMLRNLERGDNVVRGYANKRAAAAVKAVWDAARRDKVDDAEKLARLTAVISSQVADGDYVSKHLREGAVDVRCSDMSVAERAAFVTAARTLGIAVVDESRTATPHFHLNFV